MLPPPYEPPDWAPPDYNREESIDSLLSSVRNFKGDPQFSTRQRPAVANPRWLPDPQSGWYEDMMASRPTRQGVPLMDPVLNQYPDDFNEDPYLYLSRLYGFPEVEE